MLYNGLCIVVEGALARLPTSALAHRHRDTLMLGALREDVWVMPWGTVVEHLSLTHQTGVLPGGFVPFVIPSPHQRIQWLYRAAYAYHLRDDEENTWGTLGRLLHLVADLSCPAHSSRTVHLRDPFEGWVEVHGQSLITLPPHALPDEELGALTKNLAKQSRRELADGTSSPWGRLLERLGLRVPLSEEIVAAQARRLVPMAMATAAAVLTRFEEQLRATP